MLVLSRYSKVWEDDHPYKDIVNTQRLLNQVSSKKFYPLLRAHPEIDNGIEEQGQGYPYDAPDGRFTKAYNVSFAVKKT